MLSERKILIDTNFLLIPEQFKVDIFQEIERICDFKYRLFILDKSIKELENIVNKQKGKDKRAANIAISLVKAKNINIITATNKESVDNNIAELSGDYIVATQDRELRQRLKDGKIILRGKKYLELRV